MPIGLAFGVVQDLYSFLPLLLRKRARILPVYSFRTKAFVELMNRAQTALKKIYNTKRKREVTAGSYDVFHKSKLPPISERIEWP